MPSSLFLSVVKNRATILTISKVSYLVTIVLTIVGAWSIYQVNEQAIFFVDLAYRAGQLAILCYVATVLPGIYRRFKLQSEWVAILMIYRRYIGIQMYLLVMMHFWFMMGVDIFLMGNLPPFPPQPFLVAGMLANYLLFAMAVTSNDIATKKLGIWWNRIHSLTYGAVWLIFLHVALVKISVWSVLIGVTGVALLLSHLYPRILAKSNKSRTS